MKDAGLINFKPYKIIIEPLKKPRGHVINEKVELRITGDITSMTDGIILISPHYKHGRIAVEFDTIREKRTTKQGKFFFKFLTFHVPQLHELGIYSKDDLYHGFKIFIQQIRPLWEVFQNQDEFTITQINRFKEFTQLMDYANQYLTIELGVDTKEFWDTYNEEFNTMGRTKGVEG